MAESNEIREIVEQVVAETLDKHLAALRAELVERTCERLPAAAPAAPAPPATGEATPPGGAPTDLLNAAVSSVQDSTSQADILGALLEGATKFARRSALFVVRSGGGVGWRGCGLGNDDAVKNMNIDLNRGLAGRAVQDRLPTAAAAAEFDSNFISTFGPPQEGSNAVVLPLVVRDKVAALLYADVGPAPAGILDTSALECLVRTTGLWLEVLAARKAGTPAAIAEAPSPPAEKPAAPPPPPPPVAAPPPPPPPPPPVAAAPPPPPPPPAPAPASAAPAAIAPEDEEVHKKAKRFAKLLVDEIKLYNKGKVEEGRHHKDLYQRLKDDIDKSRASYEKRYGQTAAASGNYFTQELIRILADGDASSLGSGYQE
jgi:hypothetical protein